MIRGDGILKLASGKYSVWCNIQDGYEFCGEYETEEDARGQWVEAMLAYNHSKRSPSDVDLFEERPVTETKIVRVASARQWPSISDSEFNEIEACLHAATKGDWMPHEQTLQVGRTKYVDWSIGINENKDEDLGRFKRREDAEFACLMRKHASVLLALAKRRK